MKMSHSIHMLSIQIDTKSLAFEFINLELFFFTNHMKMLLGHLFLRVSLVGWDLRPRFRKTLAKSGMDTNFKNVIQRSSFSWRFYKSEHFFVPFAIDLDSRLKRTKDVDEMDEIRKNLMNEIWIV